MKKVVVLVVALFAVFTFITTYSAAQEEHGQKSTVIASSQAALPQ